MDARNTDPANFDAVTVDRDQRRRHIAKVREALRTHDRPNAGPPPKLESAAEIKHRAIAEERERTRQEITRAREGAADTLRRADRAEREIFRRHHHHIDSLAALERRCRWQRPRATRALRPRHTTRRAVASRDGPARSSSNSDDPHEHVDRAAGRRA